MPQYLVKLLLSERGRDVHRALCILGLVYCAYKITEIDKRLAVVESRARAGWVINAEK